MYASYVVIMAYKKNKKNDKQIMPTNYYKIFLNHYK